MRTAFWTSIPILRRRIIEIPYLYGELRSDEILDKLPITDRNRVRRELLKMIRDEIVQARPAEAGRGAPNLYKLAPDPQQELDFNPISFRN